MLDPETGVRIKAIAYEISQSCAACPNPVDVSGSGCMSCSCVDLALLGGWEWLHRSSQSLA